MFGYVLHACCDGKGFCFIRPRLSFEDEKKQSVKKHSVFLWVKHRDKRRKIKLDLSKEIR